jgi:hypothetical protein
MERAFRRLPDETDFEREEFSKRPSAHKCESTLRLLAPGVWLLTPLLGLPPSLANITLSRQMQKLRWASLVLLALLVLLR